MNLNKTKIFQILLKQKAILIMILQN